MVNWYVWTRAVFAAFGGFTFGYDLGAINGVKDMVGFRETFNLLEGGNRTNLSGGGNRSESTCDDDVESGAILGVIVASLLFGCLVGALLAGTFSDFAGRKVAVIVGGVLFAVGGILQCAAVFLWMIFLGRFVGGLGVGIVYTVVPVYIAEISPKEIRGRLISFVSLGLTGGVLLGFVVNLICQQYIFGWRISLSLQAVIGSILATGMLFLPEPPRCSVCNTSISIITYIILIIMGASLAEPIVQYTDLAMDVSQWASMYSILCTYQLWGRISRAVHYAGCIGML